MSERNWCPLKGLQDGLHSVAIGETSPLLDKAECIGEDCALWSTRRVKCGLTNVDPAIEREVDWENQALRQNRKELIEELKALKRQRAELLEALQRLVTTYEEFRETHLAEHPAGSQLGWSHKTTPLEQARQAIAKAEGEER